MRRAFGFRETRRTDSMWRPGRGGPTPDADERFFGGVFKVLIPDSVKAIVVKADRANPQFNVGG